MKNIWTILGLGLLGYKLYQRFGTQAKKFMDWTYEIKDVYFTGITPSVISGKVIWDFNNTSDETGKVKDINIDILYNGANIGSIFMPGPYLVPANGTAQIDTAFTLNTGVVGAKALELINELASEGDVKLTLRGSAKAALGSGFFITIPIDLDTTGKTIYSWFQ
jgi:hypothetical protein